MTSLECGVDYTLNGFKGAENVAQVDLNLIDSILIQFFKNNLQVRFSSNGAQCSESTAAQCSTFTFTGRSQNQERTHLSAQLTSNLKHNSFFINWIELTQLLCLLLCAAAGRSWRSGTNVSSAHRHEFNATAPVVYRSPFTFRTPYTHRYAIYRTHLTL